MMSLVLSLFPVLPGQGDRLEEGLDSKEGARNSLRARTQGSLAQWEPVGAGGGEGPPSLECNLRAGRALAEG